MLALFCFLIWGMLAFAGCASKVIATQPGTAGTAVTAKDTTLQTAGKSLLAVKSTIVTAATATDALCKAGKIEPGKCATAKAAYDLSKPAYDSAVDAYLLMSQGYGSPENFAAALAKVQSLATHLLELSGGAQ